MGTIFATRSSRSLQSPAEDVLGKTGLLGSTGLLGISEVLGVVGAVGLNGAPGEADDGGGSEGATAEAGSKVAPLGGSTTDGFAAVELLGCAKPAWATPD